MVYITFVDLVHPTITDCKVYKTSINPEDNHLNFGPVLFSCWWHLIYKKTTIFNTCTVRQCNAMQSINQSISQSVCQSVTNLVLCSSMISESTTLLVFYSVDSLSLWLSVDKLISYQYANQSICWQV